MRRLLIPYGFHRMYAAWAGLKRTRPRTSKERKACFGDNQPSRSDGGVVLIEKLPSMDAMRQENRRRRMKKTAAQRRGRARDQGEAE